MKDRLHLVKSTALLMAVRAALIVANAVGSGIARTGETIESWNDERFDELKLPGVEHTPAYQVVRPATG